MPITAKVIADSISPEGIRLTTMELRYPRAIHAEFMTHRMFSRNASSSRAIPVERLIAEAEDDPAVPTWWGANQRGMQARQELTGSNLEAVQREWFWARDAAVASAKLMAIRGAHKQLVNRLLEPYTHIRVLVTATDWANFYALRRHPDAEPHMQALADAMAFAQGASTPVLLNPGQWHAPYVAELYDRSSTEQAEQAVKLSVARCARVSYKTHDGQLPEVAADLALYDRLVGSNPLHASPAEHQATPDRRSDWSPPFCTESKWERPHLWGNLRGWCQYRKLLPGECARDR